MPRDAAPYEIPFDAFSHGFILTSDSEALPPDVLTWPRETLGSATVALHPKTVRVVERDLGAEGASILLLGHPVDLDADSTDAGVIGQRALRELVTGGPEAFTRYVAYLAGRFTAFAHKGGVIWGVPDTCATQSLFWSVRDGRQAVGSHIELVAATVRAEVDETALGLVRGLKELRPGYTHFFPGIATSYRGVHPVISNCRLVWRPSEAQVKHERFYPFDEIEPRPDVDAVYADFRDLFGAICRHLASFGTTGISLTAGLDSRTTFAGVLPYLDETSFTFTFFRPTKANEAHIEDLFTANRESVARRVPHRVLRSRSAEPGSVFDRVFSTTWKAYRPYEGGACPLYEDLPRDFYHLQSQHGEVGTVFYRIRTESVPSARRLTTLYQNEAVAERPEYVEKFEEFIDYAEFTDENFAGRDYHDMFYWEHRTCRWAAQKAQEGDLGHRVLQPFNSRQLLELMQSLPYRERRDKVLLRRTIEEGPISSAPPAPERAGLARRLQLALGALRS